MAYQEVCLGFFLFFLINLDFLDSMTFKFMGGILQFVSMAISLIVEDNNVFLVIIRGKKILYFTIVLVIIRFAIHALLKMMLPLA